MPISVKSLLIAILITIIAGGAYWIGSHTSKVQRSELAPTLLVYPSDESKPDEGLYMVDLVNNSEHMCYVIPRMNIVLQDDAIGYQERYLSAPHGTFSGYELGPYGRVTLQLKLVTGESWIDYPQTGKRLHPSSCDKVFLSVSGMVSETYYGTCRNFDYKLPLSSLPLKTFLSEDALSKMKKAQIDTDKNFYKKIDQLKNDPMPKDLLPDM